MHRSNQRDRAADLGDGLTLPIDYKLYVFHGRVEVIQVHVDRENCHQWVIVDRDWHGMPTDTDRINVLPPISLPLMIEGAEALDAGSNSSASTFTTRASHPDSEK
jgi:hypothetical protein